MYLIGTYPREDVCRSATTLGWGIVREAPCVALDLSALTCNCEVYWNTDDTRRYTWYKIYSSRCLLEYYRPLDLRFFSRVIDDRESDLLLSWGCIFVCLDRVTNCICLAFTEVIDELDYIVIL